MCVVVVQQRTGQPVDPPVQVASTAAITRSGGFPNSALQALSA
jgi:hypothetical protein